MSQDTLITHSNLTDRVTHEIKQMILSGEARPGDWLMPQPELAKRFGVGLSTIREAIKGLSLLGILDPQPGRGTYIDSDAVTLIHMLDFQQTQLEGIELASVYEARKVLEVELTALAAERATDDDLAALRSALDRMQNSTEDAEDYMAADIAFHMLVARASHNPLLEQFYRVVSEAMEPINNSIADVPGVKDIGLQLQEEIYEAIRTRHPQLARQRAHALVNRWRGILRAFSTMPAESLYSEVGG